MVLCAVLLMLMSGCSKEGKTGVFDNAAQNTAAGNNDGSASENTVQPVKNIAVRRVSLDKYISEYNSELRSSVTTSINTKVSDSDYIGCAKTLINKALKNPSTAVYNSEQVYEKDDYGRAIVLLDVSAQNSFGGWVRSSYYVCIQSVESDGTFYYNSALPYIEEDTSYQFDYFKEINSFDEDPADKELKDLIIDPDKVVQEGTFSISPEQELKCYKISLSSLTQIIYVDTTTEEIVSLKFITNNSLSSDKSDEAKILSTAAAVLANTGKNTTKENISNVLNLNSISEADMSEYYADEVVYDRGYSEYGIIFAVTLVDENSYSSGLYWTPNNEKKYFEALGDRFFEIGDYDNAIDYYNQGEVGGDKIPAACYNKAEQCLQNNDFENAGLYFDFAGNYKDASVRVFEVYYKAGEKYLSDMDYSAAAQYFEFAEDYSDAKEKYKECCFKQGELYANDKQYLDAITCFANAGDYSNAESRYKEASYEYAEQQLLLGNIEDAEKYFKQAGDYKDASTRMESYYYDYYDYSFKNEGSEKNTDNIALSDILSMKTDDLFDLYGNNYEVEIDNAAGIVFDKIPYTFWVEYDWNTESIVENGEIYSIQANDGGSLNYNIVIGQTRLNEFEALTDGKYSEKDAAVDYELTGLLTLVMCENGITTYYHFDDTGIVVYGLMKKSDF